MAYKSVIGLEIHAELATKSKMFCDCPNQTGQEPNTDVCPICLGHPGTLPVANFEAVRKVIKTGIALNSKIAQRSKFDRKNYFYPDLPKGYQISQYDEPLCAGGWLEIGKESEGRKKIRIRRIHLEEDTGKLSHEGNKDYSLVDFNRGGVPLMELVTEPDISNAKEAREFAEELQLILRYLDVSDADMEKGKMRAEVNISLSDENDDKLGTKVEIKNLNSLRAVENSIAFEIERQGKILSQNQKVAQETRGWDENEAKTFSQREKEEAFDYRYFPEPDLPPMDISPEEVKQIEAEISELPQERKKRFQEEYGLDSVAIDIFTKNRDFGNYFERVVSEAQEWINIQEGDRDNTRKEIFSISSLCANYLTSDVLGLLGGRDFKSEDFPPNPENFAEFIKLIYKKEISSKIAKTVLAEMVQNGQDPTDIIEKKGLSQITDCSQIGKVVDEIVAKNSKAVEDYKAGKGNALQFLIGQVLSATKGRANPDAVKEILTEKLEKAGS